MLKLKLLITFFLIFNYLKANCLNCKYKSDVKNGSICPAVYGENAGILLQGIPPIPRKLNQIVKMKNPALGFLLMISTISHTLKHGKTAGTCFKKEGRCPS